MRLLGGEAQARGAEPFTASTRRIVRVNSVVVYEVYELKIARYLQPSSGFASMDLEAEQQPAFFSFHG